MKIYWIYHVPTRNVKFFDFHSNSPIDIFYWRSLYFDEKRLQILMEIQGREDDNTYISQNSQKGGLFLCTEFPFPKA